MNTIDDYEQRFKLCQETRLEETRNLIKTREPEFHAMKPVFIEKLLREAGIFQQELDATWVQVPAEIKRILPNPENPISEGFGLIGGTGIGKTFSVVALVRERKDRALSEQMTRMVTRAMEEGDTYLIEDRIKSRNLNLNPCFHWVSWPADIAEQRGRLFSKANTEVEDWIRGTLLEPDLVVLDDIGAERQTAGDWAGEVLARVVDVRLRQEVITFWTSNLSPQDLVERYGARTCSRLFQLAPPIILPKGLPDLRLRKRVKEAV